MDAIRYIVDTLLWLLTLAFLLRLLFQLVRADFRDPIADAIVRVTNWLIMPLRRLLPPIGKVDTATVLAVLLAAALRTFVMMAMAGAGAGDPAVFLRIMLINLAELVLRIYLFAMLLYALRAAGGYTLPTTISLERATNPFLRTEDPLVQRAMGMSDADPVEVFGIMRERKNGFRA